MPHGVGYGEPFELTTVVVWITAEDKTKEGLNELNMQRTVPVEDRAAAAS